MKKTLKKISAWAGFLLALVPVLHAIQIPELQNYLSVLNDALIALAGAGGVGVLAVSNPLVEKKKNW